MKRSFLLSGFSAAIALMGLSGGCAPSTKVKAGAPVLIKFLVVDPSGAAFDLMPDGGVAMVPPLSKVYAQFDRILDPAPLSELIDGGDPMPRAGVAIIAADGTAVDSLTLYVPNGDAKFTVIPAAFGLPFANGPSLIITPTAGLPSGAAAVTVSLDPNKVRSHDQTKPFVPGEDVTGTLTFPTEALAATITVPEPDPSDAGAAPGAPPPVDPDYVVHVSFNNQTADTTMGQLQAAATVAGAPVAALGAVVARDEADPAGWTISPPATGWPAGATVTVTVGAAAADNFQHTLGTVVTASFTVKP